MERRRLELHMERALNNLRSSPSASPSVPGRSRSHTTTPVRQIHKATTAGDRNGAVGGEVGKEETVAVDAVRGGEERLMKTQLSLLKKKQAQRLKRQGSVGSATGDGANGVLQKQQMVPAMAPSPPRSALVGKEAIGALEVPSDPLPLASTLDSQRKCRTQAMQNC